MTPAEKAARRAIGRGLALFEDLALRLEQQLGGEVGSQASCALWDYRQGLRRLTQCQDLSAWRRPLSRPSKRPRHTIRVLYRYLQEAGDALTTASPLDRVQLALAMGEVERGIAALAVAIRESTRRELAPARAAQLGFGDATLHLFGGEDVLETIDG
jgi:hypothetical protein